MGRIDQSDAKKAGGVTTSIHFVISRPGSGPWPGLWRLGTITLKACSAIVFDTVMVNMWITKNNV